MRHITRYLLGSVAFWEGEGGGSGGGGAGGEQGGGSGGGAAWAPPKEMPAEFAGKDAAETVTKLWGGYSAANTRAEGLRGELSRVPKAPDSADKYTFTPDEKIKTFFGEDPSKHVGLQHARTAAHAAGIPDAAFGKFINGVYGPMVEAGLIQAPYDPKAELQSYMKHAGVDQMTASTHLKEAEGFAKGLASQLSVPADLKKDVEAAMVALTDTAAGNTLLRALSTRLASSGIRVPIESSGTYQGELTDADLDKLTADPRIDPRNMNHADTEKRFDKALRDRYDQGMAARGQKKYAGKA